MTILTAAAILLNAGFLPADALDLDERAAAVVAACGSGPRVDPAGDGCIRAVAAVWAIETARTFAPHPRPRGTGCGALQVVPVARWGNVALGFWSTPPCAVLTWDLDTSLFWGVLVLRAKAMRFGWGTPARRRRTFAAYNGSENRAGYAEAAMRVLRRVR